MNLGPYDLDQIYTGDARELSKSIPDESVDLIFTDPPYPREFLHLYGWLAQEAVRVLKPGAWLFAYGGGETTPEILDLMRVPGLDFFWIFALLHHGGYPRVWYKQLLSGYKPIYVFTKGKPSVLRWQSTVGAVSADKRYHKWGQGAGMAIKVIDMLTKPGDLVFEPFAGGGQVPAACIQTDRRFLAFEIDPSVAEKARERIRNTSKPLPGICASGDQMQMDDFLSDQTTPGMD